MSGKQFVWQEEHSNPLVTNKNTAIRRRFGRESYAGPGTWQEGEQLSDQDEPNAEDSQQIEHANLQVLAGQNQVVTVDVLKKG